MGDWYVLPSNLAGGRGLRPQPVGLSFWLNLNEEISILQGRTRLLLLLRKGTEEGPLTWSPGMESQLCDSPHQFGVINLRFPPLSSHLRKGVNHAKGRGA